MPGLRFADRFKSSAHLIPIKSLPEILRLRAQVKSAPGDAAAALRGQAGWVTGKMTGAEALVETLKAEGTCCVFGIPGIM